MTIFYLRNFLMICFFSCCYFITSAQTIKIIGTGTGSTTSQPIYTFANYSASEMIYTAAEIATTGNIVNLAFDKASGASTQQPVNIFIYMRMTSVANYGTSTAKFTTSLTGYTLVWSGNFPNSASGWQDVALTTPFAYDDLTKNLQVLVINNAGDYIASGRPAYRYTSSSTSFRYNANWNDLSASQPWNSSTQLTPVLERANVRLTFSSCPSGSTLYVDSTIAVSGKGDSWATPIKELRDALTIANSCTNISKILIAKGTYKPTSNTNRDSAFTITRPGIRLYGGYASGGATRNIQSYPTILSGDIGTISDVSDNSYHVLMLAGVAATDSVIVDGLSIVNGNANGASTKTYNSTVTNQNAGGGIYVSNTTLASKLLFSNCKVAGNSAVNGGGLINNAAAPLFVNTIFSGNKATGNGGAIVNQSVAAAKFVNCTIVSNKATNGGGIYNNAASPVITNSIIWQNDGTPASISYNTSDTLITYSIAAGTLLKGTGNLNIDPLITNAPAASLTPFVSGDFKPQPCSPAFNGGTNSALIAGITTDAGNDPRTMFTTADMGAYEIQTADLTTSTWRGVNSEWNDPVNWCYRSIPATAVNTIIPAGLAFYPAIKNGQTAFVKNITLATGASLVLQAGSMLDIAGDLSNAGTFTANGAVRFSGSVLQHLPGAASQTFQSLEINNSGAGVELNNDIAIIDSLRPLRGNFSLLNNNISLKSTANATASVSQAGSGAGFAYGSGRFIIERYIHIGTSSADMHGKSWQFLATPVQGSEDVTAFSIRQTWQENGAIVPGLGTWIADPSYNIINGYDGYAPGLYIKSYDPVANNWKGLPTADGTNTVLANDNGYMLYVRGDRSIINNDTTAQTPVTLRAKGKIYDVNVKPSDITIAPANNFRSIGNPYPSTINFKKLYETSSGIKDVFYVWDPSVAGSYNAGGYQTISAVTGYIVTPGGGKIYADDVKDFSDIQSGQAFFVQTTATGNAVIHFDEGIKTSRNSLVHRGGDVTNIPMLSAILFTSNGNLADGNRVVADDRYNNSVDDLDAKKISNGGENFGLTRDGKQLSVEARKGFTATDTLFYNMSNLKQSVYTIAIAVQHLHANNLLAFLEDNYLKTRNVVSLTDSTFISFVVNNDPASFAADRFRLVFQNATVLPVKNIIATAKRTTNAVVDVTWKIEGANDAKEFIIERSTDGVSFTAIYSTSQNNITTYQFEDKNASSSILYYRIKATSIDGNKVYSNITKVAAIISGNDISVYPNPVQDKNIQLYFHKQLQGNYEVRLINAAGQTISTQQVKVNSDNFKINIAVDQHLPAGLYHLFVTTKSIKKNIIVHVL